MVNKLRQEEQQYMEGQSEKKLAEIEKVSRNMNWVIQSTEDDEHAFERVFDDLGYSLSFQTTTVAIISLIH